MSHILCILDGMTDPGFRPENFPALHTMTLARRVDTCRGNPPESLGCILRLLGVGQVPPHLRGYAEALGAGISTGPRDLICRGSWMALDRQGCCTCPVEAPARPDMGRDCRYYHLEQYKTLVVFPEAAAWIDSLVTHAPYECAGKPAEMLCPSGCPPLEQAFRRWMLPDRCLIPWGQSVPAQLPPFPRKAAVICGTTVVRGIARLLRMDLPDVPGATGDTDTDLEAKAAAALEAARRYDFVVLHINGADEAGHRKNAEEKTDFLRRTDRLVLRPLLDSPHRLQVIADHGTDPATGTHMDFPQPLFERL